VYDKHTEVSVETVSRRICLSDLPLITLLYFCPGMECRCYAPAARLQEADIQIIRYAYRRPATWASCRNRWHGLMDTWKLHRPIKDTLFSTDR